MKIFFIILCATFIFAVSVIPTFADGSCFALNNGGITKQQFCPTPTPTLVVSTAPASTNQQQSNGQTVYPPSQTNSTPDTGPNDWSLPVLLLIAGVGLLLRNKTSIKASLKS